MTGFRILLARLRRRNVQLASRDSLGTVVEAAAETGAVVTIPGIASWLGYGQAPADPDFRASIDLGFTESFEDFCTRISRTEISS